VRYLVRVTATFIRGPATQADHDLLIELTGSSGRASDQSGVADWDDRMNGTSAYRRGPGAIAAGACWWRSYPGLTAGGRDATEREVFLSVKQDFEQQ